jgi:hypothetical protein
MIAATLRKTRFIIGNALQVVKLARDPRVIEAYLGLAGKHQDKLAG